MVDSTTRVEVRYINPEWRDRADPPRIGSRESRHANTAKRTIAVRDARAATHDDNLGLETSGFTLRSHETSSAGLDAAGRKARYHPEMLELVKATTGALAAYMLADLVRTEDQSNFNYAYSRFVHCDYNASQTRRMSLDLLGRRGIEPQPNWTFAWYNTWQPFDNVVRQNPLAMLDIRSLEPGDLIDYLYTGYATMEGDAGLVAAPVYNDAHRWWYYPNMAPDEVLLTKQNDARPGHTQQCPHTSFFDHALPQDQPPRRSVETRILAVFEKDRS